MMTVQPVGELPLMVCPESTCHTLNRSSDETCLNCGLPLAWTKQSSLFRSSLAASSVWSRTDVWQIELHVRADWPGGHAETTLDSNCDDVLNWPLPTGKQIRLTVLKGHDSAIVTCGDVETTLSLPCRDQALTGGLRLSAFNIVVGRPAIHTAPQLKKSPRLPQLPRDAEVKIGRSTASDVITRSDTSIEMCHAVIVAQDPYDLKNSRRWVADCNSAIGTFVNRHRVLAKLLEPGDFVQIGPFAWVYSAEEGRLLPEQPIEGVSVRLCKAIAGTGQMQSLNGSIHAGQFVAITGKKGSGKSTLMKILSGMPGARQSGQLLIGERGHWWSVDQHAAEFRARLGFVTQKSIVHETLTPNQIVAYSARLRGMTCDDELLRKFDLSEADCQKAFRDLSGGEKQLVRTAAELVSRPSLLLLDEPDSGLDAENRRALLKHLRRFSYLGCTVIVITHGSADVKELDDDEFDRVLRIEKSVIDGVEKGRITLDQDLSAIANRPEATSELDRFTNDAARVAKPTLGTPQRPIPQVGSGKQWCQLVAREFNLAWAVRFSTRGLLRKCLPANLKPCLDSGSAASWLGWLELPIRPCEAVFVAVIFALALAVAVSQNDIHLLGFLSVISVLWMSSSLSLLEIVGEREVFDHEHHLFLKVRSYLGAKLTANLILAAIQTVVFFVTLELARKLILEEIPMKDAILGLKASLVSGRLLLLTSIAAIGTAMGLAISAVANGRNKRASFLLPLVMICQIVFSAPITQEGGTRDELLKAYEQFNLQHCPCGNWVETWEPLKFKRPSQTPMTVASSSNAQTGANYRVRFGLCKRCSELSERLKDESEPNRMISSRDDLFAVIQPRIAENTHSRSSSPAKFWPDRIAAALSYLTISRYGDVVLRGISEPDAHENDHAAIQNWHRNACRFLVMQFVALVAITATVLCLQSRSPLAVRFKKRSAASNQRST